jgi:peptide chain release factor 1
MERQKQMAARADLRSAAQGTGDRSDKIRTYNFPQDRITDHRIGFSTIGVERVMSGENLDQILTSLIVADEKERLENFIEQQQKQLKKATK